MCSFFSRWLVRIVVSFTCAWVVLLLVLIPASSAHIDFVALQGLPSFFFFGDKLACMVVAFSRYVFSSLM